MYTGYKSAGVKGKKFVADACLLNILKILSGWLNQGSEAVREQCFICMHIKRV